MNWLKNLVSRNPADPIPVSATFTPEGVVLAPPSDADGSLQLIFLQQLAGAEELIEQNSAFLWTWDSVYRNLRDQPEDVQVAGLLPPMMELRPTLVSEGTLVDADFRVVFDGWEGPGGVRYSAISTAGGVAYLDDERPVLLPEATYRLVRQLTDFYAVSPRGELTNRKGWASLRDAALACGAQLDRFLAATVVLTPEKLDLRFDRAESGGVDVVTVEPWFEGAPRNWLSVFDANQVQDRYDIPTEHGIVQVLISTDVKEVLAGVKAMPGRRVAGRFAERFLQNPRAALGEAGVRVLDAKQIEEAREHAGIRFQRFTAKVQSDAEDCVVEVGLLIESATLDEAESRYELFATPADLRAFINGVRVRLETKEEIYRWRRYDLQLLGDTAREIETLVLAYHELIRPRITIRFADVTDLRRYSERVAGIGVQKPLVSPYLPKKQDSTWFPERVIHAPPPVYVKLTDTDGKSFEAIITPQVAEEVAHRIKLAESQGSSSIEWPDSRQRVPLDQCREVAKQVETAWKERETVGTAPRPPTNVRSKERKELLLRANIESAEYKEQRAAALRFDPASPPRLPFSLRAGVELLPHQLVGVAWLQNLLSEAPSYCRGAVLADDMGLGKTVQLLSFIARHLEECPETKPALVVAPVALLENWREETNKFFQAGTFKILTLFGAELAALRERRMSIDPELLQEGIAQFLKPGWVGEHNLVLTTYETLRDLEFSFAAERWSIVVCDEAQKIKNPATLVTRAAKKQQALFRIACTGTPVENTLIDLWCLFDWVQPGLLGSLNEFGRTYRRPIECKQDEERRRVEELRALVDCQVLRRMKKDVAKLREKVIDTAALSLRMSDYQRRLYSKALEQFKNRKDRSRPTPFKDHLTLLQYLRLVCSDPREYGTVFTTPEPLQDYRRKSPKLDWLLHTLDRIRERGEKAIIFCEFKDIQRMLACYIFETHRFLPDIINGDTSASAEHSASRQKRIAAFQRQPGYSAIILSPLAVGFGVNIQEANHVIHYTRTWNPAKEDQATDRAYRIGQTRDVFVYYPVVQADFVTFDYKLHKLLEGKRALSHDMLNGTGDVRPAEFADVTDIGGEVFDERITINDAQRLEWRYFEALCAALWRKRFRAVQLTPPTGDGGVDVVAWTGSQGELVQAKTTAIEGGELNFDAVREIVAARPLYERKYPGIDFRLVCVTNQRFSASARELARVNGVCLVEAAELETLLAEHRLTMSDLYRLLGAESVT